MQIYYTNKQKDLSLTASSIKKLIACLLRKLDVHCDEISIHFVTTRKISMLHDEFFNDPTTTDCITFPIDQDKAEYRVLGEIFVCPKTAITYAEKNNTDPYTETTLYIVHGLLHLLGYDDIVPKDRLIMRKKEKECMRYLAQEGLVLSKKKIV